MCAAEFMHPKEKRDECELVTQAADERAGKRTLRTDVLPAEERSPRARKGPRAATRRPRLRGQAATKPKSFDARTSKVAVARHPRPRWRALIKQPANSVGESVAVTAASSTGGSTLNWRSTA